MRTSKAAPTSQPSAPVRQRGSDGDFLRVPLSDGGVEFSPKSDPRFFTFSFDAGVPVSEVRMGFAATVERISEVSLFE